MTVAIGGASFENYEKAFNCLKEDEKLMKELKVSSFVFNKLGLLYYDDDNIVPGSYFCYKVAELI